MAKPNYSYEKRQRELAKKRKQDAKDAKKREAREAATAASAPAGEAQPGPGAHDDAPSAEAPAPRVHLRSTDR